MVDHLVRHFSAHRDCANPPSPRVRGHTTTRLTFAEPSFDCCSSGCLDGLCDYAAIHQARFSLAFCLKRLSCQYVNIECSHDTITSCDMTFACLLSACRHSISMYVDL